MNLNQNDLDSLSSISVPKTKTSPNVPKSQIPRSNASRASKNPTVRTPVSVLTFSTSKFGTIPTNLQKSNQKVILKEDLGTKEVSLEKKLSFQKKHSFMKILEKSFKDQKIDVESKKSVEVDET